MLSRASRSALTIASSSSEPAHAVPDAGAAGAVAQDPNAESVGGGRRELFDLALVGLDLGVDAARDVDLDLLGALRRLEDPLRSFQ